MNRQTFLILLVDFTILEMDSLRKLCSSWNLRECAIISWRGRNIVFTYTISPPLLTFNRAGCKRSGITEPSFSPLQSVCWRSCGGAIPETAYPEDYPGHRKHRRGKQSLLTDGKNPCHYRCQCRVIWTDGAEKGYTGVVGKLTDITDDYMVMENVREEGLKVLEKDRSAEFSSFYDRFKKCGFSTDGTEAWLLLQYLQIS